VPAIIHQVLLGDLEMRPKWEQARSSCLELHPTWDFKLWKSHESNQFVQEYYPQIYSTYRYYPLEIQRSNVLRYLLLDRYGGMYLDLDMRCRQNLDFLRGEEFLTPPANPTGINNAFIVSKKGHPFWTHVVDHLIQYDIDWYTPYLTNMFSTGEFKSVEIAHSFVI
jgi:mannosyltransferase OCH1-like enzyme